MRSKELPAGLRDRIVTTHSSGEGNKKFCCTEISPELNVLNKSQTEEVWHNQEQFDYL